jgi:hypothetical protein
MKSKLLQFTMLVLAAMTSHAQSNSSQDIQGNWARKNNYGVQKSATALAAFSNRVDLWSSDFSNPADWIISNSAGNASNWVIGSAIPSGAFPIDPILSSTEANGYALFDSDLDCSGNQIANLTKATSVNCAAYPTVFLEFQQQYRRYDDSTFVFVSNNGGTTWVKYSVNTALLNNDATTNPETVQLNISATAGGQANVKVRFQFWSPSTYVGPSGLTPGCAYSWMIDDVRMYTPPTPPTTGTFYTNDFSTPSSWVISNSAANTSNWVIGSTIPAGAFLIDPIASTTAANGFALFDSDLDCSGNQIPNLTTAANINCSSYPNVVLEFQQQYRRFDDSTFVFVSNNGGTTWVKYPVNSTLANNDFCATNPEVIRLNITPTAGGQANVKIRFQFWSPAGSFTAPGCGYSWMIDDVKLMTPPAYELQVLETYHANPFLDWEYGTYPLSQTRAISSVSIVRNEGGSGETATINYSITRNGTIVNSGSSAPFTISPFTNDTIEILTGYIPDAVGNYVVTSTITSANADSDLSNNTKTSSFVVTNYIYSGLTDLTTAEAFTYSAAAAPFNPSKVANRYFIANDIAFQGIDIAVSSISTDNTALTIEVFDSNDLLNPLSVGAFNISATHPTTAQYFTVVIPQALLLADGLYVASVGSSATDKQFYFYANVGDNDNSTIVNIPDANGVPTWFLSALTPAVNLNFDPTIGVTGLSTVPSVEFGAFPNPASDQLSWKVKSNEASSMNVSLIDVNGKVVFNKTITGKIASYQDTLSLASFANGVYTLELKTNSGVQTQKVVIAH